MQEQRQRANQKACDHLTALSSLKLLYPVQLQGQTHRWTKILDQALKLLGLLSKGSTPSNLGAAAAELLRSQGQDVGDAGSAPQGLLHGLPLKQRELREKARDLAHAVNNLITLVMEEVSQCGTSCLVTGSHQHLYQCASISSAVLVSHPIRGCQMSWLRQCACLLFASARH